MKAASRRCSSRTLSECSKRMPRMIVYAAGAGSHDPPMCPAIRVLEGRAARPTHAASMDLDTRDVRAGEQLDWPRLVGWLRERLPACAVPGLDVGAEPIVAQFPGGHSNLTYLVRFGG